VKVNVDGGFLNNSGRSDFGGIMHNNMDNWLLEFSRFLGLLLAYKSSFMPFTVVSLLSNGQGFNNVVIESDSTIAISLIGT
jgi:hypothetical protein